MDTLDGIETIEFADGPIRVSLDVNGGFALSGSSIQDTITVTSDAGFTLEGGAGSDTLIGGEGNDTALYEGIQSDCWREVVFIINSEAPPGYDQAPLIGERLVVNGEITAMSFSSINEVGKLLVNSRNALSEISLNGLADEANQLNDNLSALDGEFLIWSSEISINDILNQLLGSDDEKQGNGLYDIGLSQQDESVGIDDSGSGVLFINPRFKVSLFSDEG